MGLYSSQNIAETLVTSMKSMDDVAPNVAQIKADSVGTIDAIERKTSDSSLASSSSSSQIFENELILIKVYKCLQGSSSLDSRIHSSPVVFNQKPLNYTRNS